ncbi:type VI secretion system baseplate subunit TssG [Ramlibacter sp. WS9]|nr:type VI secretion system baseplate subunit TssG [Ramlibacter sp. WS9]
MRRPAHAMTRIDPLERITAQPWRYDYFSAMRWLENYFKDDPRFGTARKPSAEPVRLGQAADLSFAPSSLHAVMHDSANRKARIEVRFFGLFGPNGPLPHHLTEHARNRLLHHGDASFARFADIFHHRLLLLFYRAWAQAQPTVGLDRPDDDRFAAYVGALIGIGEPEQRGRDAAPDHAKLHFSGIYSSQIRSPEGLASILTGYLGRPVKVVQFVGSWLELPRRERTRIGAAGRRSVVAQLGGGAVLGDKVWDRQHKFRVHIGPLDHAAFESLLPEGSALPGVTALVDQYIGRELSWELKLDLRAEEVRPARLGKHGRLGWTTWLGMKNRQRMGELQLEPLAHTVPADRDR